MWKCNFGKNRPAFRAHQCGRLFFICSNGFQYRKKLTEHKWKSNKYRCKNDTWNCKDDLDIRLLQIRIKDALFSKDQKVDKTGNDW